MNNLVFLDLDGVVCNSRAMFLEKFNPSSASIKDYWDVGCCAMISNICLNFNYKIVISSARRKQFPLDFNEFINVQGLNTPKNYLYDLLEYNNITRFLVKPEWRTPEHKNGIRGREIELYLSDYSKKYGVVDSYIIIDDYINDMLPEQFPYICKTEYDEGFSFKNYKEVERYIKMIWNNKDIHLQPNTKYNKFMSEVNTNNLVFSR